MPISTPPAWTDPANSAVDVANGGIWTAAAIDGICSDLKALGGADGFSGLAARQNLLVNGGMEIWQRTVTPISVNGQYSADRWQVAVAAGNTLTVSQETLTVDTASADSLKLVQTYASGTAGAIQQRLEDYAQLRGRTLSATVRCYSSVPGAKIIISDSATQTGGAASTLTSAWETLTCTATISASTTSVTIGLFCPAANCTTYFDNAMLVISATPSVYFPLTPAEDFARCRRYYQVVQASGRWNATAAGNIFDVPIYWTTPPAIVPTVTTSGGTITNCTAAVVGISGNGARWELTSLAAGDALAVGVSVAVQADV